ncbi:hypothetical protein [Actinomadura flavalba]|uniref:hypothetical protein n=1 Tax=Actinomadura flavalba TaxID=1120938 RepID=UPI0003A3C542|nr:hypothetical protein [Actinomadura flavalba]
MSGETQERLGPYRLLKPLSGGPGEGYRAADASGRDVAIRLLEPGRGAPDIDAMRGVLSPYVVDVLGGEPTGDPGYVVSRFVPGRPLPAEIAAGGPLRGADLRAFAVGLAKALVAIHRRGLAHGALAPETVLVVDGAPVVVDFALAPADPAADLPAYARVLTFAATDAGTDVPPALAAVLEQAAEPRRLTAPGLLEAVTALDLGPAAPRSAAPLPAPVTAPPDVATAPPRFASATRAVPPVMQGWARLLAVLVVLNAAALTVLLPVIGVAANVLAVAALRVASRRPSAGKFAEALARMAGTLAVAAVVAVLVPLALAGLAAGGVRVSPLDSAAVGAAAGVLTLWTAPGVSQPRRKLELIFLRATGHPYAIAAIGTALGLLAFLGVAAAMSLTPSFAPMYGLQSSVEAYLARLHNALD